MRLIDADELISKNAAIDIVLEYAKGLYKHVGTPEDNEMYSYGRGLLLSIERNLKALPPAESEKRTEERTETHACDCISRQAAITAIDNCGCDGEDSCGEPWIYKENAVEAIEMVEPLPSAEPQIVRCKDCNFWIKQEDSLQGRCALMGTYPTGNWFCGNAER